MTSPKILAASVLLCAVSVPTALAEDRMFIYPTAQQSPEQQAEDRYDCHLWAVEQSGFDPSAALAIVAKPVAVKVGENESGGATLKGAIAAAVVGGVIGARGGDTEEGVAVGAVVGAAAGAAIEHNGEEKARDQARAQAKAEASRQEQQIAEQDFERADYRRALASCMEGRNYAVR